MNSTRTTQIIGFSVPPSMVKEVENLAEQEQRTKSELFREMFRVYCRFSLHKKIQEDYWITEIIKEAKQEEIKSPAHSLELLQSSKKLAVYGQKQAKKVGIKINTKNINKIIYDHRKSGKQT